VSDETSSHPTPDAKQRLLLAAEEVFAAKGFAGASVREICTKAGANVAAVNYYFGGDGAKERLYAAAVKNAHLCSMPPGAFNGMPEGLSPEQKLRGFIREMTRQMFLPARPTAMQLVMREFAHPTAAGAEVVREHIQPHAFLLRSILREMFPGADPTRLHMVGFSVIGQVLYYRQNRPVSELLFGPEIHAPMTAETVAEHITQFCLAALGLVEPLRFPEGSP
jgi:TetR/AcrR family transcriptional regulator, regulator of cefoperazone and chloramphenicol sensitivity